MVRSPRATERRAPRTGVPGGLSRLVLLVALVLPALLAGCDLPFQGEPREEELAVVSPFYTIELSYATEPSPRQREAFERAALRWEGVVLESLPVQDVDLAEGACGKDSPEIRRQVDDLLVLVVLDSIDGPGGTLATAGPCVVREGTFLPAVGRVRLDMGDLERLEAREVLDDVVLHEMGHVLGIGALWRRTGLLNNPSLPDAEGADTHFAAPASVAAFDAMGGEAFDVSKVPVENRQGGSGTRDAHWREDVFGAELMTGFLSTGANPLSRVTIASLEDLGYTVDREQADLYDLARPSTSILGAPTKLHLGEDLHDEPIRVVDQAGRFLGALERR